MTPGPLVSTLVAAYNADRNHLAALGIARADLWRQADRFDADSCPAGRVGHVHTAACPPSPRKART